MPSETMRFCGAIALHKPKLFSSRHAVNAVQKLLPRRHKVGHAGTLDPLAAGVLVVAIGPATKLISYTQDTSKKYLGTFRLGFTSETEDIESELVPLVDAPVPTRAQLSDAVGNFIGVIQQTPPQFSAVKVNGQRAYKLARAGKTAAIKSRSATIHSIELVSFDYPDFSLAIECGKGTYIRTLARDIAKSLGSDAVMTDLVRTAVGNFDIEDCTCPNSLTDEILASKMRAPVDLLGSLNRHHCTDEHFRELSFGRPVELRDYHSDHDEVALVDKQDRLIAIVTRTKSEVWRTKINYAPLLVE